VLFCWEGVVLSGNREAFLHGIYKDARGRRLELGYLMVLGVWLHFGNVGSGGAFQGSLNEG
jgi:hypothetical protein